jgi:hypothetical protein
MIFAWALPVEEIYYSRMALNYKKPVLPQDFPAYAQGIKFSLKFPFFSLNFFQILEFFSILCTY